MKRITSRNLSEVLWELQDLREQLAIARAELVRTERKIREVVREPRNRGLSARGPVPRYYNPADAVAALGRMSGLAYLVVPGMKNRVKPAVLMQQHASRAEAVSALSQQVIDMETKIIRAGVNLDLLPDEAEWIRSLGR